MFSVCLCVEFSLPHMHIENIGAYRNKKHHHERHGTRSKRFSEKNIMVILHRPGMAYDQYDHGHLF